MKWLQYKKPIEETCFKTNFNNESSFRIINYRKRGKCNLNNLQLEVVSRQNLKERPINKDKRKDLMDLLPLIDSVFHEFYKNIKKGYRHTQYRSRYTSRYRRFWYRRKRKRMRLILHYFNLMLRIKIIILYFIYIMFFFFNLLVILL